MTAPTTAHPGPHFSQPGQDRAAFPPAPSGRKLRVLDLFSGIGGFSLGLERTGGFETVAFCEIEPFPRKVLAKQWPEVPCYEDVRSLTGDILARDGIAVDVITGGFPCQDLSVAGKRAGLDGDRSGLWSEIVRLIGDLAPRYVIVENVANLLSGPSHKRGGWFGRVLGDLAECGYDAEWENIPASALGAPHRRERVWLVGYPCKDANSIKRGREGALGRDSLVSPQWHQEANQFARSGRSGRTGNVSDANCDNAQGQQPSGPYPQIWTQQGQRQIGSCDAGRRGQWRAEPALGRVAHGVPNRVDRLSGLGNAVVPQIPEMIGHAILQAEAAS